MVLSYLFPNSISTKKRRKEQLFTIALFSVSSISTRYTTHPACIHSTHHASGLHPLNAPCIRPASTQRTMHLACIHSTHHASGLHPLRAYCSPRIGRPDQYFFALNKVPTGSPFKISYKTLGFFPFVTSTSIPCDVAMSAACTFVRMPPVPRRDPAPPARA